MNVLYSYNKLVPAQCAPAFVLCSCVAPPSGEPEEGRVSFSPGRSPHLRANCANRALERGPRSVQAPSLLCPTKQLGGGRERGGAYIEHVYSLLPLALEDFGFPLKLKQRAVGCLSVPRYRAVRRTAH